MSQPPDHNASQSTAPSTYDTPPLKGVINLDGVLCLIRIAPMPSPLLAIKNPIILTTNVCGYF